MASAPLIPIAFALFSISLAMRLILRICSLPMALASASTSAIIGLTTRALKGVAAPRHMEPQNATMPTNVRRQSSKQVRPACVSWVTGVHHTAICYFMLIASAGATGIGHRPPAPLDRLFDLQNLVERENACALPGCSLKFDTFVPFMWAAAKKGYVRPDQAAFIYNGMCHGFTCGIDISSLSKSGYRFFENYKAATDAESQVADAIQTRVDAQKTLDLGPWSDWLEWLLKTFYAACFIFPMGAVAKKLESAVKRPTSDHTRTGLNAATDLGILRHSIETYKEIAWFLKQGYWLRVSDVKDAFLLLPLSPLLWPFFMFRFINKVSRRRHLYVHLFGDFGACGMPGTFKILMDVVLGMARCALVLTLPMVIYVDDLGLINSVCQPRAGGRDLRSHLTCR